MKSIANKHDVYKEKSKPSTGWDFLIANVVSQLREVDSLGARLRVSLQYFEKKKMSGDKFPGEEALKNAGLL